MKSAGRTSVVLSIMSLCLLGFGTASAQTIVAKKETGEKKLQVKDLPKAVQKTVEEQTKGATIKGIAKEVDKGKTQYEIETLVGSRSRDMLIDPAGRLLEVEDEIDLASLPASVQAEVKKSVGTAKLLKLESVTKGGALTGYEAIAEKGGKKSGVSMGTDGRLPSKAKK